MSILLAAAVVYSRGRQGRRETNREQRRGWVSWEFRLERRLRFVAITTYRTSPNLWLRQLLFTAAGDDHGMAHTSAARSNCSSASKACAELTLTGDSPRPPSSEVPSRGLRTSARPNTATSPPLIRSIRFHLVEAETRLGWRHSCLDDVHPPSQALRPLQPLHRTILSV